MLSGIFCFVAVFRKRFYSSWVIAFRLFLSLTSDAVSRSHYVAYFTVQTSAWWYLKTQLLLAHIIIIISSNSSSSSKCLLLYPGMTQTDQSSRVCCTYFLIDRTNVHANVARLLMFLFFVLFQQFGLDLLVCRACSEWL